MYISTCICAQVRHFENTTVDWIAGRPARRDWFLGDKLVFWNRADGNNVVLSAYVRRRPRSLARRTAVFVLGAAWVFRSLGGAAAFGRRARGLRHVGSRPRAARARP